MSDVGPSRWWSGKTGLLFGVELPSGRSCTSVTARLQRPRPARDGHRPTLPIGRILAASAASGSVSDQDKQYLATLVAQRTGLSENDAKARVKCRDLNGCWREISDFSVGQFFACHDCPRS